MHVEAISKKLGLTILQAEMSEDDYWALALGRPEGFVSGWPRANGTVSLAVKSGSLKSFLKATKTRKKASTPAQWHDLQEPQSLRRYQNGMYQ